MTKESLNNYIVNLQYLQARLTTQAIDGFKIGDCKAQCYMMDAGILDMIIGVLKCWEMPLNSLGDDTVDALVELYIEVPIGNCNCNVIPITNPAIGDDHIDVSAATLSECNIQVGTILQGSDYWYHIFPYGTYVTTITPNGLNYELYLSNNVAVTGTSATHYPTLKVLCHRSDNCLSVDDVKGLVTLANKITGTHYCVDFNLDIS